MSTRQACHWINCMTLRTTHAGSNFDVSEHPSLLTALRELSSYHDWVEHRLLPIACKWIEENRERVIEGMSDDEMDDMGAAIEKAYRLLEDDGYISRGTTAAVEVDHPMERRNPLWQAETRRRLDKWK